MTSTTYLRRNTAVPPAALTAPTVIRRAASSITRLSLRTTNHIPITKHQVILNITLQCQPYTMIDTTTRQEARSTWRQRPPPSLVAEALTPIMDTLRITTTSTTPMIRRTTRSLRGHPRPYTTLTLKIPTRILREMRMEPTRITSHLGTDRDNRSSGTGTGTVMGQTGTGKQCSQFVLDYFSTVSLSRMYRIHSSAVSYHYLNAPPFILISQSFLFALFCAYIVAYRSAHLLLPSFRVCRWNRIEISI